MPFNNIVADDLIFFAYYTNNNAFLYLLKLRKFRNITKHGPSSSNYQTRPGPGLFILLLDKSMAIKLHKTTTIP